MGKQQHGPAVVSVTACSCKFLLIPRGRYARSAHLPGAAIADACRSLLIARRTAFRKRDGGGIGIRSPDERAARHSGTPHVAIARRRWA
jgi:hypothetical protein